ncbi:hypothetical protein Tco_0579918, partial [Tanacetum coccineum]
AENTVVGRISMLEKQGEEESVDSGNGSLTEEVPINPAFP